MKKLGLVIAYSPNHNNYGTSLQGYATIKKLTQLGYTVEVIRYKKRLSVFQKCKLVVLMFATGSAKSSTRGLYEKMNKILYPNYKKNIQARTKAVNKYKITYIDKYFTMYDSFEDMAIHSGDYDAVIVGSDQVWTPMSLYSNYYNLNFVSDKVPKLSYASSFGVSKIPLFQEKATAAYLKRFSAISVREQQAKKIIEGLTEQDVKVVLDPTLLFSCAEWKEEIKTTIIDFPHPYIFCYFLGKNNSSRKFAEDLAKKTGLKILVIRHMDEYVASDETFGDFAPYDVSPNDFISYIQGAEYVLTDSFHCTVFAIIFSKLFKTFYRYTKKDKSSRNSRIDSLLQSLNLTDRIYNGETADDNIFEKINYDVVHSYLEQRREESISFLLNSLKQTMENNRGKDD